MFHLGNDEGCEADVHGHGGVVSGGGVVEGDDRAAVELVNLENVLRFTEDGINVTLTHGQGVEDERVHR